MSDEIGKHLLEEMRCMKMLQILQLLSSGMKQKQIALMLGVSDATMSRMLPKGLVIGKS
jgi:DNA-binding transcriptional regulator LsrR (DeoR family)